MIAAGFDVGDRVRVGKGKVTWIITGFGTWPNGGGDYAALTSEQGYGNTTALLPRLVMAP